MKKYLAICCLATACVLGTLAQEKKDTARSQPKPDLTGVWIVDRGKSKAGSTDKPDLPLKIRYEEPELRITHQREENGKIVERDFVYYTDGRGESNPATRLLTTNPNSGAPNLDKQVTKSKTRWSGNKLVTRSTLRNLIGGRFLEFEVIEERKLSADGQTLTEKSRTVFRSSDSMFMPANPPEFKRVYSRIPN